MYFACRIVLLHTYEQPFFRKLLLLDRLIFLPVFAGVLLPSIAVFRKTVAERQVKCFASV
ncbi:hypothetical protein C7N43_08605 [Sphingobacteriales bacterium UPWRP_1]|nr:hypothetical protein B6N25_09460 [Sphingobacteriales bacterium TSM_CSS]PSJ77507.1 hypothetical protein C7N43_08605 [Sphingobacteriales bacterium UPWRP_1]